MAEHDSFERIRQMVERGAAWVRTGPGALGMNMRLGIAVAVVLTMVAYRLVDVWALLAVAAIAVIGGWWLIKKNFAFAKENPHLALMESGDLLRFMLTDVAAKGQLEASPGPVINNPQYDQVTDTPRPDEDAK